MAYTIEIAERDGYRARLVLDQDCTCPRDDDETPCGALTLPGSRYLDVPHPGTLADDAGPRLFGDYGRYGGHHRGRYSTNEGVTIFERWVRVCHGGATLYDTPHDGPAVVWYLTPDMMRARGFEGDAATDRERMAEILRAERDTYRAWAEGDCWGVVVEQSIRWVQAPDQTAEDDAPATLQTWEQVESVWGFIGSQCAEEEARRMLAVYTPEPADA